MDFDPDHYQSKTIATTTIIITHTIQTTLLWQQILRKLPSLRLTTEPSAFQVRIVEGKNMPWPCRPHFCGHLPNPEPHPLFCLHWSREMTDWVGALFPTPKSLSSLSALCHITTMCPGWDLLPPCSANSLTNNPQRSWSHLLLLKRAVSLPYGSVSPCLDGPPRVPSETPCPLSQGLMGGLLGSASPELSLWALK